MNDVFERNEDNSSLKSCQFCRQHACLVAMQWVSGGRKIKRSDKDKPESGLLSQDDLEDVPLMTVVEMKSLALELPNICTLISQMHGHAVCVPPGWVHHVLNVRPNLKLARDFIIPGEAPLYAYYRKEIGSKLVGQRASDDFTSLEQVSLDQITWFATGSPVLYDA